MSERVTMPALGESVTEGTVTRWLKNVGDSVEVDEPLLEVSTDKVDTEIPSPVAGTLQEILAEEDETVEVGADLAVIGEGDAAPDDDGDAGESADEDAAEPQDGAEGEEAAAEGEEAANETASDSQDEDEDAAQSQDEDAQEAAAKPAAGGSGDEAEGQTVTMPALGESVTEGTVTRWLKSEGDSVDLDEPLLEVSTDKVDTEIPSPVAGVLSKILVGEDETVQVGGDLAVVGGDTQAPKQADSEQDDSKEDDTKQDDTKQGEAEPEDTDADVSGEQDKQEAAASQAQDKAEKGQDVLDASEVPPPGEAVGLGTEKTQQQESGGDVSAYVTPLVRKLAAQHGVDLGSLSGTGVGGRIRKQDVLDAARKAEQEAASQPAPQSPAAAQRAPDAAQTGGAGAGGGAAPTISAKRGSTEKMSRLRKLIASRMVESLQTSAQLTTVVEVDVTKVARLRAKAKTDFQEREGVKLSFLPFFALATTEALKQHPNLNASLDGEEVVYHAQENLGIAVDTPKGLIVPVIKDAGDLNIAGLARKIADLAERTRTNKISPDELGGGTFTLTNTGSVGALFDTPIINQPQVAILGTGTVVKRPVVVLDEDGGETIAIRSMLYLALTYDHRIVDGADAARFLQTIRARLEEGAFEV